MNGNTPLQILERQYLLLDQNFNRLSTACENPQQQDLLRRDYIVARTNYWTARNGVFQGNEPFVADVSNELRLVQQRIEDSLGQLQNIAQILQIITQAVRIGSSLVMLGASA